MRLHSRNFEVRLRRRIKSAVRSSRELKRQSRAQSPYRKHYSGTVLLRPAVSLGFGIAVWQIAEKTGHLAAGLAVISMWSFLFAFIQADRLLACLYRSSDLSALMLLPVSEFLVFRWEAQKFFFGSLWFLLDLLGGFVGAATWCHLSMGKGLIVVPLSILAWAQVLALAALLLVYFPRIPYQLASLSLMLIVFVAFVAQNLVGDALIALVDSGAPFFNLILPTGWTPSLFQLLQPAGPWLLLALLAPVLGIILTLKRSLVSLQTGYRFTEVVVPESADLPLDAGEEDEFRRPEDAAKPARFGPAAIEEIVQTRQFLKPPGWGEHGWFERWLWSWLSVRERVAAEYAFPDGVRITAPWKKTFRILAGVCLAALATAYFSRTASFWIAGAGLFITGCQALVRVLGTGRVFHSVDCGGLKIPLYTGYAIGFHEMARFLLKLSVVQLPLLLPFAIASSTLMFHLAELPVTEGAVFGLKLGALVLASRYIFVAISFSSGTNDTLRFRLGSVVLLLFLVIFGLGFIALAVASFLAPGPIVAAGLCGAAALVAYLCFSGYSWFYHRNRFDLVTVRKG